MRSILCALFLSLFVLAFVGDCDAAGRLDSAYYRKTCPSVESIVRSVTWGRVSPNASLAAKLLRLHYHDCFIRGCDASILLDTTPTNSAEKDAVPNRSISGYDVIDEVKTAVEEKCPGVVSCADIVALAARDAVSFQFQRPMWPVLMGRKDGKVSLASEVSSNLPSAFANFTTLLQQFKAKGLDITDLVTLSGAHTIGVSHCALITKRLYNFTGIGDADPSLDAPYAQTLRGICPNPPDRATTIEMDPQSSLSFDGHYFQALKQNKGLFVSDAALLTNPRSAEMARDLQKNKAFFDGFAKSMIHMGAIGVLTGGDGEVRLNCRVINAA